MQALAEIKFGGWITAELDCWPDPKDGAARSLAFIAKRHCRPERHARDLRHVTSLATQGRAPRRNGRRKSTETEETMKKHILMAGCAAFALLGALAAGRLTRPTPTPRSQR